MDQWKGRLTFTMLACFRLTYPLKYACARAASAHSSGYLKNQRHEITLTLKTVVLEVSINMVKVNGVGAVIGKNMVIMA